MQADISIFCNHAQKCDSFPILELRLPFFGNKVMIPSMSYFTYPPCKCLGIYVSKFKYFSDLNSRAKFNQKTTLKHIGKKVSNQSKNHFYNLEICMYVCKFQLLEMEINSDKRYINLLYIHLYIYIFVINNLFIFSYNFSLS